MKNKCLWVLLLVPFLMGADNIQLTDIETAIIEKDYEKSKDLAKIFISQNQPRKKSDIAQYYLGLSLLRIGDYYQAREVFEQLIRYQPEKAVRDKAYLGVIDALYMEEKFKKAIKTANKLLSISPGSEYESLIYLKLARSYLRLAKWERSKNYLNRIINEFSSSIEYHIAKQLLEEKQFFAVQVGSFLERIRAEEISLELAKKGEYAYIVETVDKAGRKFYRVRVGELSHLNDAKLLQQKLEELGYPTKIYP